MGGLRRRAALRAAAAVAAVTGPGIALLAACGRAASASGSSTSQAGALPVPQAGVTKLTFQANTQGLVSWNKTTQAVYQEFVDKNFNQNPLYKGLWATAYPWGGGSTQIADDIAGSGYQDLWELCCSDVPNAIHSGFAKPLNDLLRQDNISVNNWSKGHIEADSLAGTLYGLPSYDGTMTTIYRQDILDQLGLSYPAPTWNYLDAQRIWEQTTGTNKNGQHRYGAHVYYEQEDIDWWLHGWGAQEMNAAQDQATMASAAGVACYSFLQQLFTSNVISTGRGVKNLISEAAVFVMAHSAYVINAAVELGTKYKWDFLPNPHWPVHRACMETIDCYMFNNASKHPNEAWELMKWLNLGVPKGDGTFDPLWPKFQIQINLITPSLVNLWDYWTTTVVKVAPSLKGKALQYWSEPAIQGYARPQLFYVYDWANAMNVEQNWIEQIRSGKVSASVGLRQMEAQVNAVEAIGKSSVAKAASLSKAFPVVGKAEAAMPTGI